MLAYIYGPATNVCVVAGRASALENCDVRKAAQVVVVKSDHRVLAKSLQRTATVFPDAV